MFILRQITKDYQMINHWLGSRYIITHRESHPERFKQALEVTTTHPDQEKVFAIVNYNEGKESYPLYEGQHYYIMTPSGETFEKLKP